MTSPIPMPDMLTLLLLRSRNVIDRVCVTWVFVGVYAVRIDAEAFVVGDLSIVEAGAVAMLESTRRKGASQFTARA